MKSIWLIICGAGAIQGLFLSVYLVTTKKGKRFERILLGLLFLAITIRLVKSIGWFFYGVENNSFLNLGFVAHGFIGPLLVMYLFRKNGKKAFSKLQILLLLLPPLILTAWSPFATLQNFWYVGGYKILLYGTIFYMGWSSYLVWTLFKHKHDHFPWLRNLFVGTILFCLSYFTNYILGLNPYITGPIVYSLIIYFLSYLVFSNPQLFDLKSKKKYRNINLSPEQAESHKTKVEGAMTNGKPYLNNEFSLTSLSELTGIPNYMLSHFFNESLSQNFSDFTNSYRIAEAKQLLLEEKHRHHKISHIAYECGFNSLSSFNSAFKKFTSTSPSAYRKAQSIPSRLQLNND